MSTELDPSTFIYSINNNIICIDLQVQLYLPQFCGQAPCAPDYFIIKTPIPFYANQPKLYPNSKP